MRIVIVGASRFGAATARTLIKGGHEVVLVDMDEARLEELGEELDCGLIHGDGSLPSVQRDAFADHADALVLLTNEDDVNILAAVVGRSVGFERVVPQIVRPELLAVCEELGLDDLITPHATVARSIVRALEEGKGAAVDLRLSEGLTVRRYPAGKAAGQEAGALELPEGVRAIAVSREGRQILIEPGVTLQEGDQLVVAVRGSALDEMEARFGAET